MGRRLHASAAGRRIDRCCGPRSGDENGLLRIVVFRGGGRRDGRGRTWWCRLLRWYGGKRWRGRRRSSTAVGELGSAAAAEFVRRFDCCAATRAKLHGALPCSLVVLGNSLLPGRDWSSRCAADYTNRLLRRAPAEPARSAVHGSIRGFRFTLDDRPLTDLWRDRAAFRGHSRISSARPATRDGATRRPGDCRKWRAGRRGRHGYRQDLCLPRTSLAVRCQGHRVHGHQNVAGPALPARPADRARGAQAADIDCAAQGAGELPMPLPSRACADRWPFRKSGGRCTPAHDCALCPADR